MRALFWAIALTSNAALTHGTCDCGGDTVEDTVDVVTTTTTMMPVVTTTTTTMLDSDDNTSTTVGASMPSVTTAMLTTTTTVGASTGPTDSNDTVADRRLGDKFDDNARQLTNSSDSNDTNSDSVSDASEDCDCDEVVAVPEIVSTFTSTLSVADPAELVNFDLEAMQDALKDSQGWGDDVEAVAVFKLKTAFTLPAGTEVTTDQCAAIARTAFAVAASDEITCSSGGDGAAAATTSTTAPAARRLQAAVVLDVEIAYANADDASAGASAVADLPIADLVLAVNAEAGTTLSAAEVQQSDATVDIEIEWTVTSEASITEPAADAFETAVGPDMTVVAVVTEVEMEYTVMPCSVGLESESCPSGSSPVSAPATVACAGAVCTMSVDSGACCTLITQTSNSVNTHSMVGALMLVLPICAFLI